VGVTAPPAVQAKLLDLAECDRALQQSRVAAPRIAGNPPHPHP
jgi:hypothetical protein